MDPLSIATASISLAAAITKATVGIAQFTLEVRDAPDDLNAILKELQILGALLGPLGAGLLKHGDNHEPTFTSLLGQINDAVLGCQDVVDEIQTLVTRYTSRDTLWTKMKWAVRGKDQSNQLRSSLESYKIALGIGLHVMSISFAGDIKNDTQAIREVVEVMNLLRNDGAPPNLESRSDQNDVQRRVERWLEKMSDYTTYAETTYQETTADPDEAPASSTKGSQGVLDADTPQNSIHKIARKPVSNGPFSESVTTSLPDGVRSSPSTSRLSASSSQAPTAEESISLEHTGIFMRTVSSQQWVSPTLPTSTNLDHHASAIEMTPRKSSSQNTTDLSAFTASPKQWSLSSASFIPEFYAPSASKLGPPPPYLPRGIDWSSLVPDVLSEEQLNVLASAVKRDQEAIDRSVNKRRQLTKAHTIKMDKQLAAMINTPGDLNAKAQRCEALLMEGASIYMEASSTALQMAAQREDCGGVLPVLLSHGADPNSSHTKDARCPLTLAAATHPRNVAALVLAGGRIVTPSTHSDSAGLCSSMFYDSIVGGPWQPYCSPLIASLGPRPTSLSWATDHPFAIAHFLLTNGANPNLKGCITPTGVLFRQELSEWMVDIIRHLLLRGAQIPLIYFRSRFLQAVQSRNSAIVEVLLEYGASPGWVTGGWESWEDPVVLAAANNDLTSLRIITQHVKQARLHLFNLVCSYMFETRVSMSETAFGKAVDHLLGPGVKADPRATLHYKYTPKSKSLGTLIGSPLKERLSAIELAERVKTRNGRFREGVIRMLEVRD